MDPGYRLVYLMNANIITAIETQKKNPKRVNIFLDGEFGFGLSKMLAAYLKIGQELSNEKIEQLTIDDQLEKASQSALHFISFRPRSIAEVRRNLAAKDIPIKVIETTIERLINTSFLDDRSFACQWVENRNEFRPRSKMALKMELKVKNISEEIIESVLADINEEKLAYRAAKKYSHRLENYDQFSFRKKLSSFLARRGFSYGNINPVVDLIWNEFQEESNQGKLIQYKENS